MLLFTNLTLHLRLSNPQSGNGYGGYKRVLLFDSWPHKEWWAGISCYHIITVNTLCWPLRRLVNIM